MVPSGGDGAACKGVLVVEDDLAIRQMIAAMIELELEVRVCQAGDGLEALEILREETPCLVVTDVRMPNLDGIELVRRLRRSPDTADLPVLVISASVSSPTEALAAGADDYLQKPFEAKALIAKVRRCLLLSARSAVTI